MQYSVEDRQFINSEGNKVNYKRLVVTGYLAGEIDSIELPISADQAKIYKAMLGEAPQASSRPATKEEKEDFFNKNHDDSEISLDD